MSEPRGVTLIALIVTIIVLLILAGVTIANITGGESTIDKANEAKDETAIQAELEEIQNAISNVSAQSINKGDFSGNVDPDAIKSVLERYVSAKSEITGNGPWQITSRKTGADYAITPNCEVKRITTAKTGIYTKMGVQEGDYVNYSAGNWTQEDIDKLKNLYSGENIPDSTNPYTFGGFKLGQSKDVGVIRGENNEAIQDIEHTGWRVLKINDDGSVKIIHAGAPEWYYHPTFYKQRVNANAAKSSYRSLYILGGGKTEGTLEDIYEDVFEKDWSCYENIKYAIKKSAHCVTREEMNPTGSTWVGATGDWYRYAGTNFFVRKIQPQAGAITYVSSTDGSMKGYLRDDSAGIRPVVTIKAECLFQNINDENTNTHDTQATAWNLVI